MISNRNSVFSAASAAIGVLLIGVFANCESSSTEAKENESKKAEALEFARQDRAQAQRDSVADFQQFKSESEAQVIKNSQLIADFKVKLMTGRVSMKARFQKRLVELEKQNNNMGTKLNQYTESSEEEWKIFKHKWDKEMGRLVESLDEMMKVTN